MARTQQQEQGTAEPISLDRNHLPERPDPTAAMTRLLRLHERFLRAYPDSVAELLDACQRLVEQCCPDLRNLNLRQAGELIGVKRARVHELYREGRLGRCIDGKPRFSRCE